MPAQKNIEGTFFGRKPYTTTTFTFGPDSSFRYKGTGCMTRTFGYGTYRLRKKKLTFFFTDSVKKYMITPDTSCKQGEKISLRFQVTDRETFLPLKYTGLQLRRDSTGFKVWVTDSAGCASMQLPKKDTVYEITVDPPDFWQRKFSFIVNGNTCQDIALRIATGRRFYTDSGTVMEYKVLRQSKRKLKLKSDRNYKLKLKKVKQTMVTKIST
jgi:hypothetical protein